MDKTRLLLIDTPTFTAAGTYRVETISVEQAKSLIPGRFVMSNIANDITADNLSKVLNIVVPVNRVKYTQELDMLALYYSPVSLNFTLITKIM